MFVQLFTEMLQVIGGLIVFYFVYMYIFCIHTKQNDKSAADTPSMAQTALRELVDRAVDEARKLPGLGESESTTTQSNTSVDEQSYEDLLATAILNKVIEKYQNEHVDGNCNLIHEISSEKCKHAKTGQLSDIGTEDGNSSSLESSMLLDECSSDCSGNRIRKRHVRQDSVSLTVEEQIEEITTLYTSDEDPGCMKTNILNFQCARRVPFPEFGMDIVDPSQESSDESHDETDGSDHVVHVTLVESWEENWLFQKKKISIQSDPITMLVPNPNADYRALIGDKDAEDTSDLSELSIHSDDEIEDDLIEAINSVIPKSSEEVGSIVKSNKETVVRADDEYNRINSTIQSDSNGVSISDNVENIGKFSINTKIKESDQPVIDALIHENSMNISSPDKKVNIKNHNNQHNSELNYVELKNSDYLKNNEIPRTPVPSPVENSSCQNDATSSGLCDLEKLNEKLISIDRDKIEEQSEIVRECREAVTNPKTHLTSQFLEQEKQNESNLQLSTPPRPGTIAEREHKKWENAAPIQNNPYSQESIEKRLLERQYSRTSADINGNSAVLPTTLSSSLQIVIGANRPDIKRFGRDYYINESKSPTGEKPHRSGTSISSRPNSSLSHSNSTGSDFEQQENFEPIEATSKSLELKQNNDLLERQRKNSKNEINAKLNNRGNINSISTIFDTKKTFDDDDNKQKIRRIDLRAYGFENEFTTKNNGDVIKKKQQRIPNKLDLRSYGYVAGLRRTQSNNHIDSKVNNSFVNTKTNSEIIKGKSNLSHHRYRLTTDDNFSWTQSTENLIEDTKMTFEKFDRLKSAKSVPNIAKSGAYSYNSLKKIELENDNENINDNAHLNEQMTQDIQTVHQYEDLKIDNNPKKIEEVIDTTNYVYNYESDSLSTKTASSDESPQKFSSLKEMKHSLESLEDSDSNSFIEKQLPMPSVKILAQAFNKPLKMADKSMPKIARSMGHCNKERPSTPEIHIIDTPRQMHSLTARSISREFREGLRQISNKSNMQSINATIIEQSKIPAAINSSNLNSDESECNFNTDIIAPGKLKNNIKFWEQLQSKH